MCRECDFYVMRDMLEGRASERDVERWYRNDCHWRMRYGRRNWIMVYLSDWQHNGEGYDLTLDFYTYFDYLRFLEYRGQLREGPFRYYDERKSVSTFFFVANYKTQGSTPQRGHYIMNLEVLTDRWEERHSENLILPEYNGAERPSFFISLFYEREMGQSYNMQLLIPAGQLSYPQWMFNQIPKRTLTVGDRNTTDYTLKVNNVEQGNWNEIQADGEPYLMYDIGTNAFGSHVSQDIQRQLLLHPFRTDIEALFVSHWHADHFNILTGMNPVELSHIKQLICTSYIPNLTAFNIMMSFNLSPNASLTVLNHSRSRKCRKLTLVSGKMNVFVHSQVKSNPNNSGILLFFNGQQNCVTLTGDANYSTVKEVTNDSIAEFNSRGGYYLVVPHHGGDAKRFTCSMDRRVIKTEAIISVGLNNPYHHPDAYVVSSLQGHFPIVSRTCDAGFAEERQL